MSNCNCKSIFNLRWGNIKDAAAIYDIEVDNFEFPWNYDEIKLSFKIPSIRVVVALHNQKVIGYMIYEKYQNRYHLINISVDREYQKQGIGKQLLKLLNKRNILLEVRETNLNAQLFFKQCGFKAIKIVKNYYESCEEDAILFLKENV